jgi:hypothetical protein
MMELAHYASLESDRGSWSEMLGVSGREHNRHPGPWRLRRIAPTPHASSIMSAGVDGCEYALS